MKRIILLLISVIVITACEEKVEFVKKDVVDSTSIKKYSENRKITFSGYNWIVVNESDEGSLLDWEMPSIDSNVWVDGYGDLHLIIAKYNDNWYGAHLESLDEFSLGDFSLSFVPNLSKEDSASVLSIAVEASSRKNFNGITELGMRHYAVPMDAENNGIEFYAYNTSQKFAQVEYPVLNGNDLSNITEFLLSVQSKSMTYVLKDAQNKIVSEFAVTSKDKSQYDDIDRISFNKPPVRSKLNIRYSLVDFASNPIKDTMEIVIKKFGYVPAINPMASK